MDQDHIWSTAASGRVLELIRFGGRSDLIWGHSDLISDLLVTAQACVCDSSKGYAWIKFIFGPQVHLVEF